MLLCTMAVLARGKAQEESGSGASGAVSEPEPIPEGFKAGLLPWFKHHHATLHPVLLVYAVQLAPTDTWRPRLIVKCESPH